MDIKKNYREKNVVFHNMIALFLLQIFSNIFPFLTLPILSRFLGIEEFGTYLWLLAIINGVIVFTDYGFALSATYKIASHRDNRKYIENILYSILLCKFMLGVLIAIIVFTYLFEFSSYFQNIDSSKWIILVLVAIVIPIQSLGTEWFFQGIEKMKMITISTGLSKISYLIMIYLLITIFPNIKTALICLLLNGILVNGFYLYLIKKEGYWLKKIPIVDVYKLYIENFPIFFSNLATACRNRLGFIVLGGLATAQQTALYGAADRLHNGGMSLLSPLSQAFFPHNARTGKIGLLLKVTALLSIPLALGLLLIAWQAPYILHLIFGEAFIDATPILRWFLLLIFIKFFTTSLGYAVFSAWKQLHIMNRLIYFATLVYLLGLGSLIIFHQITALHLLYLQIAAEVILAILILWCIFHRFWIKN